MSEAGQNKWQTLEERAMRQLSNPESLVENKKAKLLLRLWQYPAFERYKVWAIYVEADGAETFLLQRIIWHRPSDGKRFSDPFAGLKHGFHANPCISTKVKNIAADVLEPYLAESLQLDVSPFVRENKIVLDGAEFGFEFRKSAAQVRFAWSGKIPAEWQPLEKWFFKTKHFLDAQFASIS